ncbi:MAG: hypothetical protein KDA61_09705, partial [Planctomycetales bacterium]|nr:hypothetical protein [Planctomycetales bacterium]
REGSEPWWELLRWESLRSVDRERAVLEQNPKHVAAIDLLKESRFTSRSRELRRIIALLEAADEATDADRKAELLQTAGAAARKFEVTGAVSGRELYEMASVLVGIPSAGMVE